MTPDVIVIGGGPAGSSAAIRLARTGRRVRLYEKSFFPRSKLCGGFLSPEGLTDLEDLGILSSLRQAGAVPLHRTVIASAHGTVIESALSAEALSVSRDVMDHLLMQEARRSGAEVIEGEEGSRHAGQADYTVIATGRAALREEKYSPWYAHSKTSYFGIQALFQNVQGVTDQVELDLVESGYVGLARQRHGIHVCALTTAEAIERHGPSLDRVMNHFIAENPVLRAHLRDATRIGNWIATGLVRMGIRQLVQEKTFYVGDAACVVDPFAGEGMSIGLYSSQLVVRALEQTRIAATQAYSALWKKAFLPSLRWNTAMRMMYSVSVVREPALRVLGWVPKGMRFITDQTRYRPIEN